MKVTFGIDVLRQLWNDRNQNDESDNITKNTWQLENKTESNNYSYASVPYSQILHWSFNDHHVSSKYRLLKIVIFIEKSNIQMRYIFFISLNVIRNNQV